MYEYSVKQSERNSLKTDTFNEPTIYELYQFRKKFSRHEYKL